MGKRWLEESVPLSFASIREDSWPTFFSLAGGGLATNGHESEGTPDPCVLIRGRGDPKSETRIKPETRNPNQTRSSKSEGSPKLETRSKSEVRSSKRRWRVRVSTVQSHQ